MAKLRDKEISRRREQARTNSSVRLARREAKTRENLGAATREDEPAKERVYRVGYLSEGLLADMGPIVPARIWLVGGDRVVSGYALLDTGRPRTALVRDYSEELGVDAFDGDVSAVIELRFPRQGQSPDILRTRHDVTSVSKAMADLPAELVSPTGRDIRIVVLLGRDYIKDKTVVYRGAEQILELRMAASRHEP